MFDIGWSELLVIGLVTIIVIGPKELPTVLRNLGRLTRKIQTMTAEFRGHVDQMMAESEIEEIRSRVKALHPTAIEAEVKKTIDKDGDLAAGLDLKQDSAPPAPSPAQGKTGHQS